MNLFGGRQMREGGEGGMGEGGREGRREGEGGREGMGEGGREEGRGRGEGGREGRDDCYTYSNRYFH